MAMASVSSAPSEQAEDMLGNDSPVDGERSGEGQDRSKPVNVVSPMTRVQLPEQNSHFPTQETVPPKSKLEIEDLDLKDVVPDSSALAFKIAQMLNRDNNRIVRHWRHLAESLQVPSDVCLSFTCDQEHSPTEDLFEHLETSKPRMTIGDLKALLRSMSRNDLVMILENEGIRDANKLSDHPEIADMFKEKLDIQSRALSWKQLAIKCKIPKKTYTKFGKPRMGPTSQLFLHLRLSDRFNRLNVGHLKSHIKEMDRFDVIKVLEQHKVKDEALVKDVFKVDTQILEETSELLDKDLRSTKNWRNLAVRLDIPNHTYEDFDSSKGDNKNPTMLLLNWLAASQTNLKAVEFLDHLRKIQRNDVVEELEKEMPAALERIRIRNQKRSEEQAVVTHKGSFFHGADVDSDGLSSNYSANGSPISLTKDQKLNLPVKDLPRSIYSKVCSRLDAEDAFFRDYRMLGEELGVSSEKIRILGQKKSSPTQSLLDDNWIIIGDFLEIMRRIDRQDVMVVIEDEMNLESSNTSESSASPPEEQEKS